MTSNFLQFSIAADNNRQHILERLRTIFIEPGTVLEIGSCSGQHAVYFSGALPHLIWQPTDRGEYLDALRENIAALAGENVHLPVQLDVSQGAWSVDPVDYIFAANVLHIMAECNVPDFFSGAGTQTKTTGKLCLYGPYKYGGSFTTESNARFDDWLKGRDPVSGIRDFEWVCELALKNDFVLVNDYAMPANNQLLVFEKS